MWINRVLSQNEANETAMLATVIDVSENTVTASCHTQAIHVPVINPCGLQSLPCVGDEVLLLPTLDGGYVCMGVPLGQKKFSRQEMKISSPSGALIHLKENGDVFINGVTISKDGTISGGRFV